MANEPNPQSNQQGPGADGAKPERAPDGLVFKESTDEYFVTEELGAMQPMMHRLLAFWFSTIGILAVVALTMSWPQPNHTSTERIELMLDSLNQRIELIMKGKVDTLSLADTSKSTAAMRTVKKDSVEQGYKISLGSEESFFFIALLGGILGGAARGLASLMDFRGYRRLFRSWSLWYFGQPLLGGMMSIIFFLIFRAGFIGNANSADAASVINPYGIAAIGALTGLFTEDATKKLAEVFEVMFSSTDKSHEGELNPDEDKEKK